LPYTTLFRSVPDVISGSAAIAVCAALVAGAITLAAYARGSPTVSPAASRFAGGLLITAASSILYWLVPLPDLMCERRLYLPLVGAALSLSGVLMGVRRRGTLVAATLLALLAPAMMLRARVPPDPTPAVSRAPRPRVAPPAPSSPGAPAPAPTSLRSCAPTGAPARRWRSTTRPSTPTRLTPTPPPDLA